MHTIVFTVYTYCPACVCEHKKQVDFVIIVSTCLHSSRYLSPIVFGHDGGVIIIMHAHNYDVHNYYYYHVDIKFLFYSRSYCS